MVDCSLLLVVCSLILGFFIRSVLDLFCFCCLLFCSFIKKQEERLEEGRGPGSIHSWRYEKCYTDISESQAHYEASTNLANYPTPIPLPVHLPFSSIFFLFSFLKMEAMGCLDLLLRPIIRHSTPCFEERGWIKLILLLKIECCLMMEVWHE